MTTAWDATVARKTRLSLQAKSRTKIMKRLLLILALLSMIPLSARGRNGSGFWSFGFAVGGPFGGVVYADGPQGSFPYYGTPVGYYYPPYGYAAYAGPMVYYGY